MRNFLFIVKKITFLVKLASVMQNKRLFIILIISLIPLLIPLIAMQFTNDVNWTIFDFAIASILLVGTGLLCEFILRKVKKTNYRIALCLATLIMLFLIWAELAVGIF